MLSFRTYNLRNCLLFQAGSPGMYLDHLIALGSTTAPVKTSISCPPDLPQVKSEPAQYTEADLHALAKDRQKKDNHNMSKLYNLSC